MSIEYFKKERGCIDISCELAREQMLRINLQRLLKETKIKQKDVADAIGLPQDTLSRFKNNKRGQTLYDDTRDRLEQYLISNGYNQFIVTSDDVAQANK